MSNELPEGKERVLRQALGFIKLDVIIPSESDTSPRHLDS